MARIHFPEEKQTQFRIHVHVQTQGEWLKKDNKLPILKHHVPVFNP